MRIGAGSDPGRAEKKEIPSGKSFNSRRTRTQIHGHPQNKRFQVVARNRMTSASGYSWVAREPRLMYGAKGARILTEINRLPQLGPASPTQNRGEPSTFRATLQLGRTDSAWSPPRSF